MEDHQEAPDQWTALEAHGVRLFRLPIPHRAYRREWRGYRDAIRSFGADVVHCHGYRPDLLAGWAALGLGIPRTSTVHGFTGGGKKNRLYEWLQLRALARFDGVIAVSRSIRDHLIGAGVPEASIGVIPNALEPTPLLEGPAARAALGIAATGPVLGWVGRISAEKGPDVLIDAIARLRDLPWVAAVLGDGPLRAEAEARAAAGGIAGRVHWLGGVPKAAQYFRAFDVFVLSSRTEGTPIVLLEAMAAGVPVVATRVGGVPDVLDAEAAVLVPPDDPAALATAIRQVLTEPGLSQRLAARAAVRVARDYAVPAWVEQHAAFYQDIRARHERGGR
jgi:glycosyltransferase involved in cell wall biosynthesis